MRLENCIARNCWWFSVLFLCY